MTAPDPLAVSQARDTAALARELAEWDPPYGEEADWEPRRRVMHRPCTWGDDAWHRAVSRLIRIHRPDYRRLLAEERARSEETQR